MGKRRDSNLDELLSSFEKKLQKATSLKSLQKRVVNTPFTNKPLIAKIDLGIVVLLKVNAKDKTIDRVMLSETELADGAVRVSAVPFKEIRIPINDKDNAIAEAVRSNTYTVTEDWWWLFTPVLTPEQAHRNQAAASIECSMVWPLPKSRGAMIFSFFQPENHLTPEHVEFADRYAALADFYLAKLLS